jgi:dCTP deaminase
MLTGNEIRLQVEAKRLIIEPFDPACIGPNSYDVHLAPDMFVYREPVLDTRRENRGRSFHIPEEGLVLQPGTLYLGATVEHTECPDLIPTYEGRSSMGRLGLFSHITAGFGDVGFRGRWTLELAVVQPVRVYAGMRIGQLSFYRPDGEVLQQYAGKYQDQVGATASRAYRDREWGLD